MNASARMKIGSVGAGGYGRSIINLFLSDYPNERPPFDLTAVCSNDFEKHPETVALLKSHGVKMFDNYDEFLAQPLDGVWLPLPIPLHRPFTEKALAAGKPVMCEKPAAGSVDDVDAMIAAREKYNKPVAIGFQDVYDRTTLPTKRRLLSGEIGKIKSATVMACWPRNSAYYGRASWAGAFKIGDSWVMDSPVNNALSHYVNIPLFLMGETEETAAKVVSIEAELYRVNPIENYDTASLRIHLNTGASLLVLFTHACATTIHPSLQIHGEKGSVVRTVEDITFKTPQGSETVTRDMANIRLDMATRFGNLVQGKPDSHRGLATLEVARTQVLVVNAASEATAVKQLADDQFNIIKQEENQTLRAIPGIEDAFTQCAKSGKMLHESGLLPWTSPAGVKDNLLAYNHFAGPKLG